MTDPKTQMIAFANELEGKVIVADTSSLLISGVNLLNILPKCVLVIPAIVVKELESKRTHATVGFLAREWLRLIEKQRVIHGIDLRSGSVIKSHPHVTLRVEPNHSAQTILPVHLQDKSNDSTILAVALSLSKEITETVVVLSNDVPMRLHATLDLELEAYEFNSTHVIGAKPFDGRYKVKVKSKDYVALNNNGEQTSKVMNKLTEETLKQLPEDHAVNAFVEIEFEEGGILGEYLFVNEKLVPIKRKKKVSGLTARTLEQDAAIDYLRAPASEIPIVSLGGGAGTGKTLMTLAVGIDELKQKKYQKIMVFRSLHEMGKGQEMGFLPGGVEEKMHAWAGAIYDAIDVLAAAKKPMKKNANAHSEIILKEEAKKIQEMVEVSPITYLRGRSLANTYIVLEEAQNFSRNEILNILSRLGEGSKIVFTFDAAQVDSKFLQSGKDADIWSVIDSLKNSSLFAHMTLLKTERSKVAELASTILEG